MAISINEYNENVNKFLVALPREMQIINNSLALSSIPLIKKNLIDDGKTGDGKSLGEYSDKPLSPGLLIGKGLGSGADKNVQTYLNQQRKSNPKEPPQISYKKFRELNNLPTEHVTLSFTGETLNDLAITSSVIVGNAILTTVSSKNSKSKTVTNKAGKQTGKIGTGDVLDELGDRYGDILSLTPQQEKEIEDSFDDEIQQLIDKYL